MAYLYYIFSIFIISNSLFTMNKDDFPNPKSLRMEPDEGTVKDDKENKAIQTTYKYYDGSKSTYTTYYQNSSDKKTCGKKQ